MLGCGIPTGKPKEPFFFKFPCPWQVRYEIIISQLQPGKAG
jgi:hypothetical protein